MVKYSYLTIAVSICRDFDEDRHIDVIDFDNPVKTLCNLIDDGRAIVEIRTVLGRANDMDNYMEPVILDDKVKYRSCLVIRKYYLKLPYPMTKKEATRFIEEITAIKLPVEPNSEEEYRLLSSIYEKLTKKVILYG